MKYDFIIVGGGLAGATAALTLSRRHHVMLIDSREPGSASAAAAAGMVNPLMGLRARPVWEMDAALDAFDDVVATSGATDLFVGPGVLRPAATPQQTADFTVSANERPDIADWIEPEAASERYPWLVAPHGTLLIRRGGGISVPGLLNRVLGTVSRQHASVLFGTRLESWDEIDGCVTVQLRNENQDSFQFLTKHLLLAVGAAYAKLEPLTELNLHPVKGQLVRVRAEGCSEALMPVSGSTYVTPEGSTLLIGSTYEHQFTDVAPRRAVSRRLLSQAAKVVPCIAGAEIRQEYAGLRVSVPGTRLPMVGPVQVGSRVWIVSGLGSRGLLTAPLIAARLAHWLEKPEAVPVRFAVRYRI